MIYDRIDLKPINVWSKNFRPNGLTLSFGTNLDGGLKFASLTGPILPYGASFAVVGTLEETFTTYICNSNSLPKTSLGTQVTGTSAVVGGVQFSPTTVITNVNYPPGLSALGTNCFPNGAIVSGYVPSTNNAVTVTLTAANAKLYGQVVPGGVQFPVTKTLESVLIPFGTKFLADMTIDGVVYPKGILKPIGAEQFLMDTVQLIDVKGNAIFSVHGIETDELITFNRPTADIARLVMYKDGVGVDCPIFACYNIVFRTNITLADIKAFNALHPSDVNPIIIDDGSSSNSSFLIPQ